MAFRTVELMKQRKQEKKGKNTYMSKKIESAVLLELKDKLSEYLMENDRVLLEVNPRVVTEFLNILTDSLLSIYGYEQIDTNKFIFYNKEIAF